MSVNPSSIHDPQSTPPLSTSAVPDAPPEGDAPGSPPGTMKSSDALFDQVAQKTVEEGGDPQKTADAIEQMKKSMMQASLTAMQQANTDSINRQKENRENSP